MGRWLTRGPLKNWNFGGPFSSNPSLVKIFCYSPHTLDTSTKAFIHILFWIKPTWIFGTSLLIIVVNKCLQLLYKRVSRIVVKFWNFNRLRFLLKRLFSQQLVKRPHIIFLWRTAILFPAFYITYNINYRDRARYSWCHFLITLFSWSLLTFCIEVTA